MTVDRYHWKRGDTVLAGIVVLMILLVVGLVVWWPWQTAAVVEVYVQGQLVEARPLSQEGEWTVQGIGGTNTLRIEDGSVRMTAAQCPDGLCMGMGAISHAGEQIICLPHQLQVILKGDTEEQVDVILP